MADPEPIECNRHLAKLMRMLGAENDNVRRTAFAALEKFMRANGVTWTDLGNLVECGGERQYNEAEGKYTEMEMRELAQAYRQEGVEAGIKVGMARARNGGNGRMTLPKPLEMAEFCHARLSRLKDDNQRKFVTEMC